MTPPIYPDFRELTLDDAGLMAPMLAADGSGVAEYSFANLYLFRHAHCYRFSVWQDFLFVVGKSYGGDAYAFPPIGKGDVTAAVEKLEAVFDPGQQPVFFPVSRSRAESWFPPERWQRVADRDQADYVYSRDELANLPGKKFHKRRNRLAKVLRELGASYEYRELEDTHLEGCLALAAGWCDIRCSVERPSTYLETEATKEALTLRRRLGLRGGVIVVEGESRAFCLGEPLTADTFVVHFEKSDPAAEGLAQLINRDFCLHSLGGYRYVNREQDLGDPGLRHAKESYHPVRLVEKYRVKRK